MKWRNQTRIANLRFNLFKGTVAEQISLQDESITREQIEKALDFVGLTDYVAALENGLDTQVNNDNLFSQGQKQLLSIVISVLQKNGRSSHHLIDIALEKLTLKLYRKIP